MGIKVTESSFEKTLAQLEAIPKVVYSTTEEVFASEGEKVVEQIRNGGMSSWNNVSGSLRSSIGGGVIRKGNIVKTFGFDTVLAGSEGANKGKELLARLAIEYAHYDVSLVIVAGEDYAVYVEAIDGKVVLSTGFLYLEKTLPKLLRERITNALKRL